jgi:Ca2+:H+ antiporter
VLGICFFAGGTRFSEQGFSVGAAQINSSLLIISVVGMLLPAVFYYSISAGTSAQPASVELTAKATSYVLKISHGVALLLLLSTWLLKRSCVITADLDPSIHLLYRVSTSVSRDELPIVACTDHGCSTHTHIYDDVDNPYVTPSLKYSQLRSASSSSVDIRYDEVRLVPISPMMSEMPIAAAPEEEVPSINWFATVVLLGAVTALVAVTSEFLVGSIDGLSTKSGTPHLAFAPNVTAKMPAQA